MSFFDDDVQVVPLITCENDAYTCEESTLKWLQSCKDPICPIACAGRYRTGKSFLLNRLADAQPNCGFGVGDSVQACTKGLWIYQKFFEGPGNLKIVFIDTEGIDALDANDTHDVRIFTLALLLSSTFLYNSVGAIDETALQTLNLMTQVVKNVKVSRADETQDLSPHMPHFFWILRDFSLRLVNRSGEQITCDEYLENALITEDKNKCHVRDAIRTAFAKRKLVTLPRPTHDDSNINRLETRLLNMAPRFRDEVAALRQTLFDSILPMRASSKSIGGAAYVELIRYYANVVGTDKVPVIQDSWALMAGIQARDVKDRLCLEMEAFLVAVQHAPGVEDAMAQKVAEVMATFDAESFTPQDPTIRGRLHKQVTDLVAQHLARLHERLRQEIGRRLDAIEEAVARSPLELSVVLQAQVADVTRDCDEATARMWQGAVYEKMVHAWIPALVQHADSARLATESEHALLRAELEELRCAHEKTTRNETLEVERLQVACASLASENETLASEKESLEHRLAELQDMEARVEEQPVGVVLTENETLASEVESTLETLSQKYTSLEMKHTEDQEEKERLRVKVAELEDKLKHLHETHRQVEQHWKVGIDKIQTDAKQACDQVKQNLQAEMVILQTEKASVESQLAREQQSLAIMRENERLFEQKLKSTAEAHEREVVLLKEQVTKGREQMESANSKLLEVHTTMLSDIRTANDKLRENQNKYTKSHHELQNKYTDCVREFECSKSENRTMKRKISEMRECVEKNLALRREAQEYDIAHAKLKTELEQLKVTFQEMAKEKESLRNENLKIHNELAILRSDKRISDVRDQIDTMIS